MVDGRGVGVGDEHGGGALREDEGEDVTHSIHMEVDTDTGRQASARPISSTARKKKLELDARNGRVAGRQLAISET
ncbi:hypothetical protein EYF80_025819 [Liparis tanakae]|uniref:Uncharacterized protein n=1 Tax=Liparis tanakae TaxID=230148 RepID=A0A4Z2HDN1_9TELE|nr:hypothetical protein EYF80_025819 [Liparis tanakae]